MMSRIVQLLKEGTRIQANQFNFIFLLTGFIYRIGFVTQDDILYPQLTVEETLIFAACLRLPGSMSERQKYERVEVIIKDLGLERLVYNSCVNI